MSDTAKSALVLVFNGVEEVEAITPTDLLRRALVRTTVASLSATTTVEGRNAIKFEADTLIADIDPEPFDAIVIPGGPGVFEFVDNVEIGKLLKSYYRSERLIAAICAAPKLLAVNDIISKYPATSHASVRSSLPFPNDAPVVIADNVITSQGAGTAVKFSLAIIEKLRGRQVAIEIAKSIHA